MEWSIPGRAWHGFAPLRRPVLALRASVARGAGSSLVRSGSIYFLANLTSRLLVFGTLPVLARILGPSEYGRWAVVLSMVALLVVVTDAGLSKAVVRSVTEYAGDMERVRAYVRQTYRARLLLSGAALLLWLLAGAPAWGWIMGPDLGFFPVGLLVIVAAVSDALVNFAAGIYRACEAPVRFAILRLCYGVVQCAAAIGVVVLLAPTVTGVLAGYALGSIVAALVAARVQLLDFRPRQRVRLPDEPGRSLRLGVPLIPHDLGYWIRNTADPIVLARSLPLAAVGAYHLAYSAALAFSLIITSLDAAVEPRIYRHLKEGRAGRQSVADYAGHFLLWTGIAACAAMVAGRYLVPWEAFGVHEAGRYFPVLVAAYFVFGHYTVYVKPLIYHRRTRLVPWLTLPPALFGVALTAVLAPRFGADVAAASTLLTFLLMAAGVYVQSQRLDPIPFHRARILGISVLVVSAGIVAALPTGAGVPAPVIAAYLIAVPCALLAMALHGSRNGPTYLS